MNLTNQALELIINQSNTGIYIIQDNRIVFHNPYFRNLTGYSFDDIFESNFLDIVNSKDKKLLKLLFSENFKEISSKPSRSFTFRINHKNGHLLWLKTTVALIEWNGNTALLNNCYDITQQKEFEQTLALEEQNFKLLVNGFEDLVCILSKSGTIIQTNKATYSKLKFEEQNLLMSGIVNVIDANDRERVKKAISSAYNGKREQITINLITSKGKAIPVEARFFNGIWSQKQVVLAIFQDITDRIEAEKALRLSEEKFSKAFESSSALMSISTFKDGTYLDVNETFLRLTGLTREEVIGKKSGELGIYADYHLREELKRKLISGDVIRNRETTIYNKQGNKLICLFSAELISIQSKSCILVVMNDITSRKKAEEKIAQSELRFRQLGELLPEMVFEANEKGIITFANNFLLKTFNLNEQEVNQKVNVSTLFTNKSQSIIANYLLKSHKNPELHSVELEAQIGREHTIPVLVHIIATFKDDKVYRYMGVMVDITESKKQEAELIKAKELAEEASKAKEQFLSVMSHEIRTPMNAIIGTTNILFQENPSNHQMGYLKALKFSAENLLVLLNDILDFSKIEAGKFQIHNQTFNLSDVTKGSFRTFETMAQQKGIDFLMEFDGNVTEKVLGDPIRINQILANLISNALKFTEKGSVQLMLSKAKETKTHYQIRFSVADTGIGVPSDKIDEIFREFSQVYSPKNQRIGGTGLGLTISKKLVELMGGKLMLSTQLGKGSEFYFILKFKKVHKQELSPDTKLINSKSNISIKGLKILVAEDNEINAMIALKFLEKWEAEATHVENGKEALEMLKKKKFDLVLMDLEMPVMDGYEATREIRKMKSKIPIIALTASAMIDVRNRLTQTGMDGFVLKPFKPSDLLEKIHFFAIRKAKS